jgi:sulfide:quinone oxidoreductase
MGDDRVGMANVNFLSGPVPVASYLPPSAEGAQSKKRFAAERMQRWFGA